MFGRHVGWADGCVVGGEIILEVVVGLKTKLQVYSEQEKDELQQVEVKTTKFHGGDLGMNTVPHQWQLLLW